MLTMAMSLDGFITGPNDDAQNPAGVNGMRLMDWLGRRTTRSNESATSPTASRRACSKPRLQPATAT
jgi:hypothetical protein